MKIMKGDGLKKGLGPRDHPTSCIILGVDMAMELPSSNGHDDSCLFQKGSGCLSTDRDTF